MPRRASQAISDSPVSAQTVETWGGLGDKAAVAAVFHRLTAAELAELLFDRAAILANSQCAHAAGIIRGKPGGRRPIDDAPEVETVLAMVDDGTATSVASAARHVAERIAEKHSVHAAKCRLESKARAIIRRRKSI